MNVSLRLAPHLRNFVVAGIIVSSLSAATAGIVSDPRFRYHIKSRQQVEQLPVGAKIALVCAKCKTVNIEEVDTNRRFLSWFVPGAKHNCPGCRGQFENFSGARGSRGYYMHTCSKCGDRALACSAKSPGHKRH